MKILIDMNLSPQWAEILAAAGQTAVHWSSVGRATAQDGEIPAWAKQKGYIVFTHDLDFGAILAATDASGPSVFQIRSRDVSPEGARETVLKTLTECQDYLGRGSLVSVDEHTARIRILPLRD